MNFTRQGVRDHIALICRNIRRESILISKCTTRRRNHSRLRSRNQGCHHRERLPGRWNKLSQKTFNIFIGQHTCDIWSSSQTGDLGCPRFSAKWWIGDKSFDLPTVNFDGGWVGASRASLACSCQLSSTFALAEMNHDKSKKKVAKNLPSSEDFRRGLSTY